MDDARHIEDDDTSWLADGIAQGTSPRVIEVGDMVNSSRAPTKGIPSEALCSRKSQLLSMG